MGNQGKHAANRVVKEVYYMAVSASGQDKANPVF